MITPQPNKYLEVIMPYRKIAKTTEIIIDEEAWTLVEYDKVSVPNIIYMSFTESKVNEMRDNVEESIANYDTLNEWGISAFEEVAISASSIYTPVIRISCNGKMVDYDTTKLTITTTPGLLVNEDGTISVLSEHNEEETIVFQYENALFEQKIKLVTDDAPNYIIFGDDRVKVTQSAEYKLYSNNELVDCSFEIDNKKYARIISQSGGTCMIKANEDNKIGEFVLLARDSSGNILCQKVISIIALWQVK